MKIFFFTLLISVFLLEPSNLLNKVNAWLINEITTYQKIEKRINDGEHWEDVCDDVEAFRHRKENAERLFNTIEQWEKEAL